MRNPRSDPERRNKPADPTAERTAEESTQSASGLTGGKPSPADAPDGDMKGHEQLIARKRAAERATPRRYELEEDPAMPHDDATLKTKI